LATSEDLSAVWLTLRLAAVSTALLLVIGTPIAWWLARTRSRFKGPVGALVALPLVLPPTVLGFYLLVLMGPSGPVGKLTQSVGLGLLPFTFGGLVVGSVIYSLPFVAVPLARTGFLGAAVLAFAHTIGEFGVVLMIGGNIPGATKVLSVALYDHVEALEYGSAHILAAGMLVFSFLVLLAVYGRGLRLSR
jgi:molybdate transport system permease protein